MANKQDSFYFENFMQCTKYSCVAADLLDETLRGFEPAHIKDKLDKIHEQEHNADMAKHELINVLAKAFITPIEREDILQLSQNIDEVVDKIDDVLQRIYCHNILTIRADALNMSSLIVKCCNEVYNLVSQLQNFKRSKTIKQHIININSLEEEADAVYINCVRTLHTSDTPAIDIFSWHEIYGYMEKCMDACEHVADVVEMIIMKNS